MRKASAYPPVGIVALRALALQEERRRIVVAHGIRGPVPAAYTVTEAHLHCLRGVKHAAYRGNKLPFTGVVVSGTVVVVDHIIQAQREIWGAPGLIVGLHDRDKGAVDERGRLCDGGHGGGG